jgi:hypothetical protein
VSAWAAEDLAAITANACWRLIAVPASIESSVLSTERTLL